MHVDDFVDETRDRDDNKAYAKWFFFLHRLDAVHQMLWETQIAAYKLFCTYRNKRYRVTGASRMGDIWLAEDFNRDSGYDLRVDLADCSGWSPAPCC